MCKVPMENKPSLSANMSFQPSFVDLCLPVGTEKALKRGSRIKNPKYSKAHTGLYKPIDSTFVYGDTYPRSWLNSQLICLQHRDLSALHTTSKMLLQVDEHPEAPQD